MEYSHKEAGMHYYKFKCSCGNEKILALGNVVAGRTRSCGCLLKEQARINGKLHSTKHGMSNTPTYNSWQAMKDRCHDLENPYYGGRGITYCEEWEDFRNFFRDMGERPAEHTLDRINGDLNYCPENCRWATAQLQKLNVPPSRLKHADK